MPFYTKVFYPFRSKALPDASSGGRLSQLDGLRGFLALGVLVHHAAIYRHYLRDGSWWTPSGSLAQLGPLAVTLFFMVTAYLFYGRLIDEQGQPDWRRLYIGRLFRIGPVYLLAIGGMFAVVAARSGFQLRVPAGQLAGEVMSWLALGAGPRVDLNGYPDTRHLLAGVTWTLQSEWLFYASLPLLAVAVRRGHKIIVGLPAMGLMLTLAGLASAIGPAIPACIAPFFAGMLGAALRGRAGASGWLASILIAAIFASVLGLGLDPHRPAAILLLAVAFALIVEGGTVFGLLTCRPARWLGEISYGVYLLHGLVLSQLGAIGTVRDLALTAPAAQLPLLALVAALTLLLAELAHRLVERPGIRCGRLVARWRRGRAGSRLAAERLSNPPPASPATGHQPKSTAPDRANNPTSAAAQADLQSRARASGGGSPRFPGQVLIYRRHADILSARRPAQATRPGRMRANRRQHPAAAEPPGRDEPAFTGTPRRAGERGAVLPGATSRPPRSLVTTTQGVGSSRRARQITTRSTSSRLISSRRRS